ncbi:hypothetical protein Ndes2526B_g03502 [Nannochloris sp. 'desiccata']|nr:hypothetical protein KSW81_001201 [Chlorella desiccata (nom. nud.)]KAG7668146.1 hypothetical protein KSW81_002046 [Chlorella desiccata (nom. nud.)]KAG7671133.1 hypothetical protein KSW81_003278 [Chlorella desiccata (nom. nud.)]KAH7622608.1 hypothetical protein NADE_005191 [Chlorella desiccata (nom. nud.)]KAH7622667.1 hypothetical protein NADE_005249 [Chlorella desiccata (nom. nud.)]
MPPRRLVILTDPPPGLYQDVDLDSHPILRVSAKARYALEPQHQRALFTRAVAKAIHAHIPSDAPLQPSEYLTEHASYTTVDGYMRVGFTIKHPAAVPSLEAATAATGTLPLPAEVEGGITFVDARVSWENYSAEYTRELINVPANINQADLASFLSTDRRRCTIVRQISGPSNSSQEGRLIVKFKASSLADIPTDFQLPGLAGKTHLIHVRMPSATWTADAIDQDLLTLTPPLVVSSAWNVPRRPSSTSPVSQPPASRSAPAAARAAQPPGPSTAKRSKRVQVSAQEAAVETKRQAALQKLAEHAAKKREREAESAAIAKAAKEAAEAKALAAAAAAAAAGVTSANGAGPSGQVRTRSSPLSTVAAAAKSAAIHSATEPAAGHVAGTTIVTPGVHGILAGTFAGMAGAATIDAAAAPSGALDLPPLRINPDRQARAAPTAATSSEAAATTGSEDGTDDDEDYDPMAEDSDLTSNDDDSMSGVSLAAEDFDLEDPPIHSPPAPADGETNGGAPPSQH